MLHQGSPGGAIRLATAACLIAWLLGTDSELRADPKGSPVERIRLPDDATADRVQPCPQGDGVPIRRWELRLPRGQAPGDAHTAHPPPKTDRVRVIRRGNSGRSAREAAVAGLPLEQLDTQDRKRVAHVVQSSALFRELPTLAIEVEPAVYTFFAEHPDVAVSIWRVMEISKFQMWQTGRFEYEAEDGEGSSGVFHVLYRKNGRTLVLCDGLYNTPLLAKPIKATALFHVQTEFATSSAGTNYARHTGHLFVTFPSQTVETAAKIISPISNLIIDRNFREISLFVHMMSLAMVKQPGWVRHVADRMEGVLDVRKSQLAELTERVYLEARKRRAAQAAEPSNLSPPTQSEPFHTASVESTPSEAADDAGQNRPANAAE